jgi:hypothetical protein
MAFPPGKKLPLASPFNINGAPLHTNSFTPAFTVQFCAESPIDNTDKSGTIRQNPTLLKRVGIEAIIFDKEGIKINAKFC